MMQQLTKILSKDRFIIVYLTGLSLYAIGLPLSKTAMSIALALLGIHWLLAKGWELFPSFNSKKGIAFYSFLLISIIHLVGLLYTTNFEYALKDLRIKLPLLILPIFAITAPPLDEKQYNTILKVFILSVFVGTIISLAILIIKKPTDPRLLVPYNSHIRFSLMVCIAALIIVLHFLPKSNNLKLKLLWGGAGLWMLISMTFVESLTGVALLIVGLLLTPIWYLLQHKTTKVVKVISYSVLTLLLAVGVMQIFKLKKEFNPDIECLTLNLEEFSKAGTRYSHDIGPPHNENGNLIWVYMAEEELKDAWNKKGSLPYDYKLESGYKIGDILIRFLSSKGFRKDEEGVNALTNKEIKMVEAGYTNYKYRNILPFRKRIDQLKWEYWNYIGGGDPKGHSLLQRFELWKVGISLYSEHAIIGVGTGDIKTEFYNHLNKINSSLAGTPLRAHNQYITILITFGIFGFILFVFALATPLFLLRKRLIPWVIAAIAIILLSMVFEDTLETQVGVSLFSFIYVFSIFQNVNNINYENLPD